MLAAFVFFVVEYTFYRITVKLLKEEYLRPAAPYPFSEVKAPENALIKLLTD